MVDKIYPKELQLNEAKASDTGVPFLNLYLPVSNEIISTKIYDRRDQFDIFIFSFLDGDVHRAIFYDEGYMYTFIN